MKKIDIVYNVMDLWKDKDIEGLLACLSDDIVWHFAVGISPPLSGKEATRGWLNEFSGQVRNNKWRAVSYAETATQLFVEGVEDYETPEGQRVVFPYTGIYDFEGELISGWRDYFDSGLSARLTSGKPPPRFVEDLNNREELVR